MNKEYNEAIKQATQSHSLYEEGKLRESLDLYIKTIRIFIDLYKKDSNTKRKKEIYPIIENSMNIAEKIKLVLKMPNTIKVKTVPIKIANKI